MGSESKWVEIIHRDSPEDAPVVVTTTAFNNVWMNKGWTMVDHGEVPAVADQDNEDPFQDYKEVQ